MANRIPFDLAEALNGASVWHNSRNLAVINVTKIGNRVAFQLPQDGETIYQCLLDGTHADGDGTPILSLVPPAPKRVTEWINVYPDGESGSYLWDCAWDANINAPTDSSPLQLEIVREQQPDGTWKVIGTDQLAAEKEASNGN